MEIEINTSSLRLSFNQFPLINLTFNEFIDRLNKEIEINPNRFANQTLTNFFIEEIREKDEFILMLKELIKFPHWISLYSYTNHYISRVINKIPTSSNTTEFSQIEQRKTMFDHRPINR